MYRVLEYFSDKKVDISKAHVFTEQNIKELGLESTPQYFTAYDANLYKTSAKTIYTNIKAAIKNNIDSIRDQIRKYQSNNFTTAIYQLKDTLIGSNLTKKRNELSKELDEAIDKFKSDIKSILPEKFEEKKLELTELITQFEKRNNALSITNNKDENNGRLAAKIALFKLVD